MRRSHTSFPRRRRSWAALSVAALLLATPLMGTLAATHAPGGEGAADAPPSRSEQYDSLLDSLNDFFFQQTTAAATAQATPTPAPAAATPAQTPAPAAATPAATPEGKVMGKAERKSLKYPLPDWSPLGSAGPETVEAIDPSDEEFVVLPDRWRFGWPRFDRYSPKHETPWVEGSTFDPYNQNVLKADYPIIGNHTFLNLNLQSNSTLNPRTVAVGGRRDQFFTNQNIVMGAEIFGGTTVFE